MRMLAFVLALTLGACASAPKPSVVRLAITADQDANIDSRGRLGPILLRLYELKGPIAFEGADFFSLAEHDEATIGSDLIAKEEIKLKQGEALPAKERTLKPETKYLGAFVIFRDIERAEWRALLPVPGQKKKLLVLKENPTVTIHVEKRKVGISAN